MVALGAPLGRAFVDVSGRPFVDGSYDGLVAIDSSETDSELGPEQLASRAVADMAANARHQNGADQRSRQDLEAACVVIHDTLEAARESPRPWTDAPEADRAPIRAGSPH